MTEKREVQIPASALVEIIRRMLELPEPTICRHSVAAWLLSVLERHGCKVSDALAHAVVFAEPDEDALRLLDSEAARWGKEKAELP